jgi:nucleotide-binding universal stress UspA family protein
MKKILLPLEDTERSLKALHYAKKHYAPAEAEFVLMMSDERLGYSAKSDAEAAAIRAIEDKLSVISSTLEGYKVSTVAVVGKAGIRITRAARETGCDMIIMCKSSKEDMLSSIGSTTEYVINNASCDVLIVSESINARSEYRGLIYRTAKGVVNLRGQLGDKQSECLLPSINEDCIYHIDVTVGKVRFFHTAYNPDTRNWDLPPQPGQEVTMDIAAGQSVNILVKADSTEGKADRIRIVNRDMKKEAVFSFRISSAASADEAASKTEVASEKKPLADRATMEIPKASIDELIPKDFEAPEVPTFEPAGQPAPSAETPAEPAPSAETPVETASAAPEVKAEEPAAPPAVQEVQAEEIPAVQEIKAEPAPAAGTATAVQEIKTEEAPVPATEAAPAAEEVKAVEVPAPAVQEVKTEETPAPAAEAVPVVEEIKSGRTDAPAPSEEAVFAVEIHE